MDILLIDDEVRKAQAIVTYFQEVCGWNAEIAPGPDRALSLLRGRQDKPYDLIILDIMMDPGSVVPREMSDGGKATGLVLLRLIVELTGGEARVILYTARTDLDEQVKAEKCVAAYIQKPRTVRELAREIQALFGVKEGI